MKDIEYFSEKRNLARVAAGFKGGDSFKKPRTLGPTSFVGWPSQTDAKFMDSNMIKQGTPIDVWNERRQKSI